MRELKVKVFVDFIINMVNFCLLCLTKIIWRNNKTRDFERICVHKEGALGDTICMVPALYEIRKRYPNAELTLLTTPVVADGLSASTLLSDEEWLDRIIVYYWDEANPLNKGKRYFSNLGKIYEFDCFINLQYEKARLRVQFKNIYWAMKLKVKYATGFYISTLNIFPKQQNKGHYDNEVMRGLKHLPFHTEGKPEFPFQFSKEDHEIVDNILSVIKKKLLLISFSGKGSAKFWPYENFSEVCRRWCQLGYEAAVIGSSNDYSNGEKIINGIENAHNFCGLTTPKQCMLLIKKVGRIVSIDTGTNHMAAAMGASLISVFSSFYYQDKWFPYGNNNLVFYKKMPCSPCLKKECPLHTNACMKAITVDEVWAAIIKRFDQKKKNEVDR